jgi:signal transduction histidine kinase/DNA-binding NarL/FixJ family response regulator
MNKPLLLNLSLKFIFIILLAIIALLAIMVGGVNSSVQVLSERTSQQRIREEAKVIERRFEEAKESLLAETKLLVSSAGLIETVSKQDINRLRRMILIAGAPFGFDQLDVVNAAGEPLFMMAHEQVESSQKNELLSLALLGIETTAFITVEKQEEKGEEVELRLAAVAPLREESGQIAGGVLATRKIDKEFLETINFARQEPDLIVIANGKLVTIDYPEEVEPLLSDSALLPDKRTTQQVLSGQVIIPEGQLFELERPYALAYIPLMDPESGAMIAMVTDINELLTFKQILIRNTTTIFTAFAFFVIVLVTWFVNQMVRKPINHLKQVAKQMEAGDYTQRAKDMTADEIGQLARSFNQMADAIQLRDQKLRERESQLHELTTELSQTLSTLQSAQEELMVAKESAERANEAKSEFLSNMSHELRSPLNGVLGYAQLLQRSQSLNRSDKKGLEIIHQSGHHLLTLINDILDLSKIEARQMELNPQELHLRSFLHGIAELIRMRAEEKELLFRFEAEEDLPIGVLADEKRLRQILLNLLGNAVKFTHQGQVALNVSRRDNRSGGDVTLRFEVADTGVGMTAEQLEKIFLPFEQVGDAEQRAKGTGLGLAITRQLVALMGGEIKVKSELGKGSTFWFDLTAPVVVAEMTIEQSLNEPIRGYMGAKCKIMVVDDQAENRLLLRDMLTPLGFEIEEAENGAIAIEKVGQLDFDMILMDLLMPVMNGFETVKEIRQFSPELPIIAISASVFEHDRRRSQQAGCNAFLAKPIDEQKLFSLIQEQLNLTWIYERSQESKALAPAPKQEEESLIVPPSIELVSLYQLAILGNIGGIREWTSHIEQVDSKYIPFAQKVRDLAINFEDERLLDLVEKYLATQAIK